MTNYTPVAYARVCKYCQEDFTAKNKLRFHCYDNEVCAKSYKRDRQDSRTTQCSVCGKPARARGLCKTHYKASRGSQWVRRNKTYVKTCDFCGSTFETTTKTTRHCSSMCGKRNLAGWSKSKEVAIRVPQSRRAPSVTHRRTASRLTCGSCRVCGVQFVSFDMDVTCSNQCRDAYRRQVRALHKDKRRALKRNAFVASVYRKKVFEADGYRCHICHKMTKRTQVVPHPLAPTLDHVTPLALGGTHEPANCRTAHFKCNSSKGHRGTGDQMLLFAL